jgi:hypothetical protein
MSENIITGQMFPSKRDEVRDNVGNKGKNTEFKEVTIDWINIKYKVPQNTEKLVCRLNCCWPKLAVILGF